VQTRAYGAFRDSTKR